MPGMDGPGLYRALSDSRPDRIADLGLIAGDTPNPQAKQFRDASERTCLGKPIKPGGLRESVDLPMRRKAN